MIERRKIDGVLKTNKTPQKLDEVRYPLVNYNVQITVTWLHMNHNCTNLLLLPHVHRFALIFLAQVKCIDADITKVVQ